MLQRARGSRVDVVGKHHCAHCVHSQVVQHSNGHLPSARHTHGTWTAHFHQHVFGTACNNRWSAYTTVSTRNHVNDGKRTQLLLIRSLAHPASRPDAPLVCMCASEAHNTQTRKTLKICDMECDALCLVEVHDQTEQCPPRDHRIHTLGFSSAARGFVPLAEERCFGMQVTTTYFVGADTLSKDTSAWTQKPTTTTTQRHTCEPDGAAMELRVNAEELSALRPRHSVRLRYDVLVVRVRGDASRRRHVNRGQRARDEKCSRVVNHLPS